MAIIRVEFILSTTEEQIVRLIKEAGNKTISEMVKLLKKSEKEITSNVENLVRASILAPEGVPKNTTYGLTGFYFSYA